jgi:uncharacterized repeat protein (TIGR03803 family)
MKTKSTLFQMRLPCAVAVPPRHSCAPSAAISFWRDKAAGSRRRVGAALWPAAKAEGDSVLQSEDQPTNNKPKMKMKNLFTCLGRASCAAWVLPALIAVLNLLPAGRVTAQTFTTLHSFTALPPYPNNTNSDGAFPNGGLTTNSSGNTLYGTAVDGGSSGNGTVFAVNTDGTGFTNLHSFTAGDYDPSFSYTNSDGANPFAGSILSGDTLFGAAWQGGSAGNGTLFAVNTDGTGFTNLHSFTAGSGFFPGVTNSDGAGPIGLMLSGNTLYGAAVGGGSSSEGTVFKLNINGTGFTNLHSFTAGGFDSSFTFTNSEGAYPIGGLILSGNTLYGTANNGGSSGNGTVFAVNTDGTGFTAVHNFTASSTNSSGAYINSDGADPIAGLILSGNTLYGTASAGGNSGNGTVFSLSFQPQLTITPSGPNVILAWPTNVAGFDFTGYTLQTAPALTGTFTNLPAATSPYTNPITGPQQFFRLSQ